MSELGLDFGTLRHSWREVPAGTGRVFSDQYLQLPRTDFLESWRSSYSRTQGAQERAWYQTLYKEFMRDKAVLEIGSGFGFDGVTFLQGGAKQWTFCDIAQTNLDVVRRACAELELRADFVFIDDNFACFDNLGMYDVIWAKGSLKNVPFQFARAECMKILPHLKTGGRWIELCYPLERWIREGRLPFTEWGKLTNGEGMVWMEWYDLMKLKQRLFPAALQVVLDFNFQDDTLNWFDLQLLRPFDPKQTILDVDVFPPGLAPEAHGDSEIRAEGDEIEIVTADPIWSYAASFDLGPAIAQSQDVFGSVDNGFTVEIELCVSRGDIGILIVAEDISNAVCREYVVSTEREPKTLIIDVPPKAGARRLVFRNSAAGTRSQFKLKHAKLRFAGATTSEATASPET